MSNAPLLRRSIRVRKFHLVQIHGIQLFGFTRSYIQIQRITGTSALSYVRVPKTVLSVTTTGIYTGPDGLFR